VRWRYHQAALMTASPKIKRVNTFLVNFMTLSESDLSLILRFDCLISSGSVLL